jgi:hypothetical protein
MYTENDTFLFQASIRLRNIKEETRVILAKLHETFVVYSTHMPMSNEWKTNMSLFFFLLLMFTIGLHFLFFFLTF